VQCLEVPDLQGREEGERIVGWGLVNDSSKPRMTASSDCRGNRQPGWSTDQRIDELSVQVSKVLSAEGISLLGRTKVFV